MKDFSQLRVRDYLEMFWRRKWYFIVTTIVVTAATAFIALRMPRVYRSETTILVEMQGISEGYVKPTGSDRIEDRLNLISQELRSRGVLENLIKEFRLYQYGIAPRFFVEDALKEMKNNIDVNVRSRNTFTVAYSAPTAVLARDITKRLADDVIGFQTRSREEQAVVTDQFIDEQFHQAELQLATQEEKLKAFKLSHLGTLPEQNAGNLAALNGLHNQLITNESALQRAQDQESMLEQRIQDQQRLNRLSQEITSKAGGKEGDGPLLLNSRTGLLNQLSTKRAALADLLVKYTDNFPDIIRLKKEIHELEVKLSNLPVAEDTAVALGKRSGTGLPGSGEADLTGLKAQLSTIKREIANRQKEHDDVMQQIQVYQGRLNLTPRVEQELLTITRDYESLKQNYRSLQDKKFNTQVAANLEKSKDNAVFKVIEEAYLPEQPVKPDRQLIALLGLLGGVVMGLGLVVALEYLDTTLGDEDVVLSELNLPVLVSVPEIKKNGESLSISPGRGQRLLKQA